MIMMGGPHVFLGFLLIPKCGWRCIVLRPCNLSRNGCLTMLLRPTFHRLLWNVPVFIWRGELRGTSQATNIPLANALTHPHPSPPHLFLRETVSEHGALPERFVPGKETESVLRLVKHPKLRPKDLSHRQSLAGEAPGSSTAEAAAQSGSPVPYFTPGPSRHQPSNAHPPTSEWERPFMITLIIGRQQLVLHGTMGMQVDELQRTAGSLTLLDPSSIQLVARGITLRPGSVLGDYPATWSSTCVGPQGLHVTVLSHPERGPTLPPHETFQASLRINNASPNSSRGVNGDTRVAESISTLAPSSMRFRVEEGVQSARAERTRSHQEVPARLGRPGESSHLIWLLYEDGRAVSQVVWGTMLVRELCIRIGDFAHVSPDTVFC
jgi:hypothetical protein